VRKESEFRLSVAGAPLIATTGVPRHGFINLEIWNFGEVVGAIGARMFKPYLIVSVGALCPA
jgi:hypothetical protein